MYLESENEENDDIDFEYDNEAFKTYKNFFLQDVYCDDTSDDEDILPIHHPQLIILTKNGIMFIQHVY